MIRACKRMPSFAELTSTRCPGCNFCSMRTRAPWALTFSVNVLSLSFASSCRQTSTLTILAIRFSDRPFDIVLLVPETLRALGSMFTLRPRSLPIGTFVHTRGVIWYCYEFPRSNVPRRSFASKNSVPALQHCLPIACQRLSYTVKLRVQAEGNRSFPAGDFLSAL